MKNRHPPATAHGAAHIACAVALVASSPALAWGQDNPPPPVAPAAAPPAQAAESMPAGQEAAAPPTPFPSTPEAGQPPPAPTAEEVKKIAVGVGLRLGFDAARKKVGLSPLNIRPYISGQVHKYIKFEGNLDSDLHTIGPANVEVVRILDAVAKLEFDDLFNVWVGRFLPPSDRANLSGPYFQNAWNYPATSRYPNIYAGRDNGAAIWGQVGGGRFKWQVGAFNGGTADSLDSFRYTGRLVLNLLDPESGYYNSSTYYGAKDVLAIAGVAQYRNGNSVGGTGADFVAGSFDLLFEKKLGAAGVLTFEGAYDNFEKSGLGSSVTALASYLLPMKVGFGQPQPNVRYQHSFLGAGVSSKILDGGVTYVIDGHNARVALNYRREELALGGGNDSVQLGIQIQK